MNPVKLDNNNVVFTVANELNRVEIIWRKRNYCPLFVIS